MKVTESGDGSPFPPPGREPTSVRPSRYSVKFALTTRDEPERINKTSSSGLNPGRSLALDCSVGDSYCRSASNIAAMRLGAYDVLDKPVSIDDLPHLVRTAILASHEGRLCSVPKSPRLQTLRQCADVGPGASAAERWVFNVIKGCLAMHDPKTLKLWADEVAVSYTTLRESCALVGIGAHDARNLMRMLRAILHMSVDGSPLDTLLDTGDSRTLAQLIETAGFRSPADLQAASISDFFCRQRFVAHASPALVLLRDLVVCELR